MFHPANVANSIIFDFVLAARRTDTVSTKSTMVLAVFDAERSLAYIASLVLFPIVFVVLEVVLDSA